MATDRPNISLFPFANNQFNQMQMNNMMNNPMLMNNVVNNPMMNMNNNMMNNPMGMNGMNNMMNNPMGMNNMMSNPKGSNMMNNQMLMNNIMNMQIPNNNQMMMAQVNQIPMQNQNIIINNIQNNQNQIKPTKKKNNIKRKIPPILEKNANRKIESISFEVEKGLKPMSEPLYNENIKYIFDDLFKRSKKILNEKGEFHHFKNEPLRILHYKFDTNETEFSNFGKKSLITGLARAYQFHFPINVSPDMIWILVLQGYSSFMDKYSELVREKYVNFEGKKTIHIELSDSPLDEATEEEWDGMIDDCVEKISKYVGKETILNLQSDFTTTNAASLLVSQTSIMSAMKNYFVYKGICGICGISKIILEGSLEDWEKIKSKLNYLSKFGLNWWTKHLIPIIDNIIKTKEYYQKNMTLNNELINFWKNMIKIKDKNGEYVRDIFNGWIIKFIPDYSGKLPKLYDELKEEDIPDQIISCPLEILEVRYDGYKTNYKCDIHSGFYGVIQDKKSLAIKPVIGYAVVLEDKETSILTKEDKEEIIKNYFN